MKKALPVLLVMMLMAGCASNNTAASKSSSSRMGCEWQGSSETCNTDDSETTKSEEIGKAADMSGYDSYDPDTEYVFVNSDVKNMLNKMIDGDTFVTFFGFSSCPWCRDAMPILNETALKYNAKVDYIDTRSDPSWKSNLDLKDYDQLVDAIGDLFPKDDDGKAHLDVPFVVFFKDGKVVYSAGYPQYDAHERKINDEEAQEERDNYTKGFEAIK